MFLRAALDWARRWAEGPESSAAALRCAVLRTYPAPSQAFLWCRVHDGKLGDCGRNWQWKVAVAGWRGEQATAPSIRHDELYAALGVGDSPVSPRVSTAATHNGNVRTVLAKYKKHKTMWRQVLQHCEEE